MITRLTVLYDASCGLCRTARAWLAARAQLVPLEFVAAGSTEARRRYPALDVRDTLADITVVADDGGVYTGDGAWLICLWALDDYRGLAARLAEPSMHPLARAVVATAARVRNYGRDCDGTCAI
ncbi:thiol-disulfide oxidoreductase DCC family protein [Dactylosporangium sucinum]|uniref:Thiol-disulfide oxidoreductase n=1 Tax=Dactylosporangium sucinum TaxID=1424081 RepID=A0A917U6F6_9ACTN|nr:DCC1-like thiol-disulfide oxidoreductase family protein [Dactylosporangium sucinum]GGM61520.1 hypothetical protein GCM10007977_073720 [Dactylosporangium sucinum]